MEQKKPGDAIVGVRLEKEHLQGKQFPSREILDRFSKEVPIWINSLDYQVSMLNTYGLLYYKIPFRTEGIELDSNGVPTDRKSTRLNSSHANISYAVFCLKKKKQHTTHSLNHT